jgi:hypothetical protein
MNTCKEAWRPVAGYEGIYEVSSAGRVRRLAGSQNCRSTRLMKLHVDAGRKNPQCRHLYVCLTRNNKIRWKLVHRLVLEAFVGACPAGSECRHLDGNAQNNNIANLCWGTRQENMDDRKVLGERFGTMKLKREEVRTIRRRRSNGERPKSLATEYGVTPTTIWHVCSRRTWKFV